MPTGNLVGMALVKPLVVSYLRFSRPEQALGDSVRRQLALSDAWCQANGTTIDTSLTDKGVSAFRGSNAEVGALGTFLSLVQNGRVPKGSVLLVESLDRLSRQEVRLALTAFLNVINAGITVVTLADGREYSEDKCELAELVTSIVVMSRAHEESATKSRRLSEAWKAKRSKLCEKPMTSRLPAWCQLRGGKVVLVEAKAEAVRTIYRWALDGMGLGTIVRRANNDLPPVGRKDYYVRSYIFKLLKNRSVLGEFQPHKITYVSGKKRREPIGDVVLDYFPRIVEPDDYAAVQARLARGRRTGGPTSGYVSIFRGLLHAPDGSRYHVSNKGTEGGHVLIPATVLDGRKGAGRQVSFPLPAFETAFFGRLADMANLEMDDVDTDALRRKLLAVEGEIGLTVAKVESYTQALLDADTPSPSTVKLIASLDGKLTKLQADRESLQAELRTAELGSPADAADQITQMLVDTMLHQMPAEKRMKLRSLVQQIVRRADVTVSRKFSMTSADVRVELATGKTYSYLVKCHGHDHNMVTVEWDGGVDKTAVDGEGGGRRYYEESEIVQMRKDGAKISEIIQRTGLSTSCIYRMFGRAGVKPQSIKPDVQSLRWAGHKCKGAGDR